MRLNERISATKSELRKIDDEIKALDSYREQLVSRANMNLGKLDLLKELQGELETAKQAQKDEDEIQEP
jgi:hypothetical protein